MTAEKPQTAEELLAEVQHELSLLPGLAPALRDEMAVGLKMARDLIEVKWPRWIVERDEQIRREAADAAIEAACKQLCRKCQDGEALIVNDGSFYPRGKFLHRTRPPSSWWHQKCKASLIREALRAENLDE